MGGQLLQKSSWKHAYAQNCLVSIIKELKTNLKTKFISIIPCYYTLNFWSYSLAVLADKITP